MRLDRAPDRSGLNWLSHCYGRWEVRTRSQILLRPQFTDKWHSDSTNPWSLRSFRTEIEMNFMIICLMPGRLTDLRAATCYWQDSRLFLTAYCSPQPRPPPGYNMYIVHLHHHRQMLHTTERSLFSQQLEWAKSDCRESEIYFPESQDIFSPGSRLSFTESLHLLHS